MGSRWKPSGEHRVEAVRRLLRGLDNDDEVFELSSAIADIHPQNNTFPEEVLMRVAVAPLDLARIDDRAPIADESLCETFLRECGRENGTMQLAIEILGAERITPALPPDRRASEAGRRRERRVSYLLAMPSSALAGSPRMMDQYSTRTSSSISTGSRSP